MFTISTTDGGSRDCGGTTRRDFLRIGGAVAFGGVGLPAISALQARAAGKDSALRDAVTGRSVVMLFLGGGPSQFETFDPKPDGVGDYRSITGCEKTTIPGECFGGTFPKLAKLAHRMAIVRSLQHSVGDHDKAISHVIQAGNASGAGMGPLFSRLRGSTHPVTGVPTCAHLAADEVDPQYLRERERIARGDSPGDLGTSFAPFNPTGGGPLNKNMELRLPRERLDDRVGLLRSLDGLSRTLDAAGQMDGMDRFERQAMDLVLGNAKSAFDLSREDKSLVERYDTSRFKIGHKKMRPSTLGRQMLLARRLCEAGCGFVTVQASGWDMHADGNNPGIAKGMEMLGRPVDQAVSTFLEDVESRGLSDKILLVITGDFGRTPKVNKNGGRDHWPSLCTLALAGGGLKMGQIVGRSAERGDVPAGDPVTLGSLMATVMHVLFDTATLRLAANLPRPIVEMMENERPIHELV